MFYQYSSEEVGKIQRGDFELWQWIQVQLRSSIKEQKPIIKKEKEKWIEKPYLFIHFFGCCGLPMMKQLSRSLGKVGSVWN